MIVGVCDGECVIVKEKKKKGKRNHCNNMQLPGTV